MENLAFYVVLLLVLVENGTSLIPEPCATVQNLRRKVCCPTTSDPCGESKGRGKCVSVDAIEGSKGGSGDLRYSWPTKLFKRLCKCSGNYGGYGCDECKFGYSMNALGHCRRQPIRVRKSLKDVKWDWYISVLNKTKNTQSRYYVITEDFKTAITHSSDRALMDSIVNPTLYNLFIWIHHFSAKDNESKYGFSIYTTASQTLTWGYEVALP